MTSQQSGQHSSTASVAAAVERLSQAQATGVPCAPVRDLIGTDDLDAAYAVQQGLVQARIAGGARVVGRKIGATSKAVQDQLGVDQPDFGYLLDDMDVSPRGGDEPISMRTLLQPRVEAEVAFVLARDLDLAEDELTIDAVRAAVEVALPALEIVDSRIDKWAIGFTDTVADNASSGLFVVGTDGRKLDAVEPRDVDRGAHRLEGDRVLGEVEVGTEHERDLTLDPWLQQGAHRDRVVGGDVHVVEQVAEVRLVDPELVLHGLRRGADLAAHHACSPGDPGLHEALLHGVRRVQVVGADQVAHGRTRDTGRLGLGESLDGGPDRGRARVLGGHVTDSRTCYSFSP